MNKYISFLLISMMINPTALHAAGRIQDSDVKSLTDVGGTVNVSRLINASKIYDATNNQQLSLSIANGALGGGSGGAVGTFSNFLNTKNPDAEKGTTLNWTNTGGGLSVINTGQADGVYSFQFVASAAASKATSFLGLIPALSYSKNGLVRFTYSTTNADFILQVTDGTNVLGQAVLPAASTYQYGLVTLVLPSSGSIQVNVISQSAGTINFDDLYVGENFQAGITSTTATPTVKVFTSGTSTYTTPTGVSYIKVRVVGGGGGAAGGGNVGTVGSGISGAGSSFGSLLTANGGGSTANYNGGSGGGVIVNSPAIALVAITGGTGAAAGYITVSSSSYPPPGNGGANALGGSGGGVLNQNGVSGAVNTGAGGGGGGSGNQNGGTSGGGGGAGGFLEAIIISPLSSYSWSVGAGGAGGSPGTSGSQGGAGGSGVVIVEEFYTPSTNQLYLASSGGLNPGDRVEGFYTSCPVGTIKADGSAISRTTYASLFAAISTTYGTGDGTTTFNLPNAQGVFTRGAGSQTIGGIAYTGTQGTTQNDTTKKNGLALSDPGHSHAFAAGDNVNGNQSGNPNGYTVSSTSTTNYGNIKGTTANGTGISLGAGDAETRPANITDLVCIRTLPASPAPVIVGSVSSGSTGSERIERLKTTGGTTPTITSQSGTWVSAVTRPAAGQQVATFSGFSSIPTCTCSPVGSRDRMCSIVTITLTSITTNISNGPGTDIDNDREIICMGPR